MNALPDNLGCTIKRKKRTFNSHTLTLKGATRGNILSLMNALEAHSVTSPVAKDILSFIQHAVDESGDEELKYAVNNLRNGSA